MSIYNDAKFLLRGNKLTLYKSVFAELRTLRRQSICACYAGQAYAFIS